MLKKKIIVLVLMLLVSLTGCASVAVERTFSDGTTLRATYVRFFDQNIEGFSLTAPEGWAVSFDKQSSDVELAFRLCVISASIGGSE